MAISRIKTDGIQDDAVTSPKIGHNPDFDGQYVRVPHGTTAERPGSPAAGFLRFNTTIGTLEQWNTTTNSWQAIDSPPIISTLAYSGSNTATDPAGGETITLTGSNFKSGANVTVGGTSAPSVSVVSSTSITFTTPAKTAGDYDVAVTNTNGLAATLQNGISFNGTPAFTTAAGNVGTVLEDVAMSTITIVAAEPDGGTLAFSVTSGALPTGVSLGSANGQLTGTPNVNPTSDTTFNFTVTATDDESQTNSRAFNLIVLRPIYATQISNSLRFDGTSSYLMKTESAAPTSTTQTTFSGWVKRSNLGQEHIWTAYNSNVAGYIYYNTDDKLVVYLDKSSGGSDELNVTTDARYRDNAAWYHILVKYDVGQSANSDKVKIYVNGTLQSATYSQTGSAVDAHRLLSSGTVNRFGQSFNGSSWFDGYMSDLYVIDGQALTPTSFAEEYYGVWVPKAYSGTFGTNGFHLEFADSSNLGDDTSGNTNDFTANALSTYDSVTDSPTTNFATFNYNNFPVMTFAEGGLKITTTTNNRTVWGSQSIPDTGKWYFEMEATDYITNGGVWTGLGYDTHLGDNEMDQGGIRLSTYYGGIYLNNTQQSGGYANQSTNYTADGDVYSFAIDMDNELFYIGRNGTWFNSADPSAGTGGLDISANITAKGTKPYVPALGRGGSHNETYTWNFGQDSTFAGGRSATSNADANGVGEFAYTVPTNFLSLCAKNLAESPINTSLDDRPEDYFDTILYQAATSNGTYTHGNITFQADLAWIKCRNAGERYFIIDSVRGNQGITDKFLTVNMDAEGANGVNATTFTQTATGYQFVESSISSGELYYNNRTYVGWNWKAGGAPTADNSAGQGAVPTAGSSKVDGSNRTAAYTGITSPKRQTVSTKAGFSITRYTGNATGAGAANSVDHGFTVQPEMIWIKGITGSRNWTVYNKYLSDDNSYFLRLNGNDDEVTTSSDMWNGLSPTTSVVHMGYEFTVNQNAVDYMMYAWHSVEGYSKIGKYNGTGTTGGALVHCGFKPAFVMLKRIGTSGDGSWFMLDNKRSPSNEVRISLSQGTPNDVTDTNFMDFTANGFKIRTAGGAVNTNLNDYLFMAFAENPFKYSTGR